MNDSQPYTHHNTPSEALNLPSDELSLAELNILYMHTLKRIELLREEVAFLRVQLNKAQVKIIEFDKRGVKE